jgi:hypothetical protein
MQHRRIRNQGVPVPVGRVLVEFDVLRRMPVSYAHSKFRKQFAARFAVPLDGFRGKQRQLGIVGKIHGPERWFLKTLGPKAERDFAPRSEFYGGTYGVAEGTSEEHCVVVHLVLKA